MYQSSTIYALSSGPVPAGLAVIRISGLLSKSALAALCGVVPPDRQFQLADIRDRHGLLLDRGLIVSFTGPASFTGEDCVELHVHGGRASVAGVLETLGKLDGLRPADAGEFTRRAFVNGKMDLTSVEALGDLIAAETEMQRRLALANSGGAQSELYGSWRDRILRARALIEADIDFSDEDGVPDNVASGLTATLDALTSEMDAHLAGARSGEIIRDGFQVVILGAPNAGKSSLLNYIAKRDVAIVSEEPGTTRDLIEVALDLNGVKIIMTDTAGVRDDPGHVESIGIAKAVAKANAADLVLLVEDLSNPAAVDAAIGIPALRIGSKSDLLAGGFADVSYDNQISARTGAGIDGLLGRIGDLAAASVSSAMDGVVPSRLRHVELISSCRDHLVAAKAASLSIELRGEELRLAGDDIGRLTGVIGTEDVLGEIFSSFCVGK